MDLQLNGKTVLITGGSRGIGRGIALALAQAGCNVALTARDNAALDNVAGEVEAAGVKAHVIVADLLREGAANEVAQAVEKRCGRLDIPVNNAGAVGRGNF